MKKFHKITITGSTYSDSIEAAQEIAYAAAQATCLEGVKYSVEEAVEESVTLTEVPTESNAAQAA